MKTGGLVSAAIRTKRRLLLDTRGSMTIPGIFLFTMLIAVSGLAIDMQRVFGVHGEMQAFVDNAALAAAAELDGQSTALTRAYNAACGTPCSAAQGPLVGGPAGSARFASDTTLTVRKVTFLSQLDNDPGPLGATPTALEISSGWVRCTFDNDPNLDGVPNPTWTPGNCNTDPARARDTKFVEVVAAERTVQFLMLPVADVILTMVGAPPITDQARLRLRATAGFRRSICNNVPLMICNPSEITNGKGSDFLYTPGQMILARMQEKGAAWEPPNFGLLNSFTGEGDDLKLRDALGLVSPGTICTDDEVTVKPGQNVGPVIQGINTRFDMYQGALNPEPAYRPAPNVVRGMQAKGKGNACQTEVSTTSMPLPRDNCFMDPPTPGAGPCVAYNGVERFGDGNWARDQYWAMNHPGVMPPAGYATMSRYQVYRYEIANNLDVNGNEQTRPSCYNDVANPPDTHPDRDRRLAYVAVVNCIENAGNLGSGTFVPVKAYAKIFMTEPVGHTDWTGMERTVDGVTVKWPNINNADLPIEIVNVVTPNDESGHLHVYPVLYR